ncbi:MAG: sigma-70 family RNA polymerase sigma factor [Polyangiaceae bacterium]
MIKIALGPHEHAVSKSLAHQVELPPPTIEPGVGGEDRLRVMFETHFEFVWRLLRRSGLSDSRADDAAQEVFIVASQKLPHILVGSERSFLFGTALRVASTIRRSAEYRRERVEDVEDLGSQESRQSHGVSTEDLVDQRIAREALDSILESMEDDLRLVFVLFELENTSMAEIATLLEIPPGTVASRLRRAREFFHTKVDARFPKRLREYDE